MGIQDSGNTRPVTEETYRFSPYWQGLNITPEPVSTTKGTDIMLGMLLDQYRNKPVLLAYFQAFFDEMDTLFTQVDSVYFGRFLERAGGIQLDVIGRILNQSRQVSLPQVYFGMDGAPNADKMADEASPADGGIFQSGADEGFVDTPLGDITYRRILKAKALCHARNERSYELIYNCVYNLLDKIPRKIHLNQTNPRELELIVSREDVSAFDVTVILYFYPYMVPLGTKFIVTREVL